MKTPVSIAILCAFSFVILKMIFHFTGMFRGNITPMAMTNMLCLLLSVSVGLYFHFLTRKDPSESFMSELKQGLKAGMVYTFIVSVFLYLYYSQIDQKVIFDMQSERIEYFREALNDPAQFAQIKNSNKAYELMTAEEMLEDFRANTITIISARSVFLMSLMAMMLLSIAYSLTITIIYRTVLFRKRA